MIGLRDKKAGNRHILGKENPMLWTSPCRKKINTECKYWKVKTMRVRRGWRDNTGWPKKEEGAQETHKVSQWITVNIIQEYPAGRGMHFAWKAGIYWPARELWSLQLVIQHCYGPCEGMIRLKQFKVYYLYAVFCYLNSANNYKPECGVEPWNLP